MLTRYAASAADERARDAHRACPPTDSAKCGNGIQVSSHWPSCLSAFRVAAEPVRHRSSSRKAIITGSSLSRPLSRSTVTLRAVIA